MDDWKFQVNCNRTYVELKYGHLRAWVSSPMPHCNRTYVELKYEKPFKKKMKGVL